MSAWGMAKQGNISGAIVRVLETIFGFTMPQPLADLVARLTSDAGLIAKSFAQTAWDAAAESDPLDQIIEKATAAAVAEGKTVAKQDIADWAGIIDRNTSPAPAPVAAS